MIVNPATSTPTSLFDDASATLGATAYAVLKAAAQAAREPMYVKDARGRLIFANAAALAAGLVATDSAALEENEQRAIESRRPVTTPRPRRRVGMRRGWRFVHTPLFDERGECIAVLGAASGLTDDADDDAEPGQDDRRYRTALHAVFGMMYEWDVRADRVERNSGLLELLGVPPSEAVSNAAWWRERMHPDDLPAIDAKFARAKREGKKTLDTEYRIRHADGRWLHVWDRASIVRDEAGDVIAVLGNTLDITDRRIAEHRLHLAIDATHLGLWDVDVASGEIDCSPRAREIFGLSSRARLSFDDWLASIHDDDRARVEALVAQIKTKANGAVHAAEFRLRASDRPDAASRWIAVTLRAQIEGGARKRRVVGLIGTVLDVTERKRHEDRLRESEQQLRLVTDAAPVGIARCRSDLTYRFVNQGYARDVLNMPAFDAAGRSLRELMSERQFAAIQPYVERVLKGERVSYEGNIPIRRGEQERYLQVDYVPEFDETGNVTGWIAVVVDITERKSAEGKLYQREREFETLVENSPDIIARFARDLRLLYINRSVEYATGFAPEHFIGRTFAELGLPDEMSSAISLAASEAVATGREQPCAFDLRRDRLPRHYVARAVPELDQHGHAESVLMVVYDVTDRVNAQNERDQLLTREQAARAEAEAAAHARDQFLAIVSHELRSPLNGIQSWAHVLESQLSEPTSSTKRALGGIRIGVEQQVRLIEDLLDATRIMSGNLSIVKQPVTLLSTVEAAIDSVRGTAQGKRMEFEARIELTTEQVEGDPDRLQQIVWNLLSNAVKFTPSGGRIELHAYREHDDAVIVVKDNGKGIPPDFLPHMFDWFRRSEVASSRRQDGLGLGLALVRHLCDLHQGNVSAQSDGEDRGATFVVRLPLRNAADLSPSLRDHERPPAAAPDALQGLHVLLVDDQAETREALSIALAHYGARITTLPSGHDAVAWLERNPPPDVLVCDIAMPDQDGHVTLQRIRALESHRGVSVENRLPAIALSAFTQREDRLRALATGFQIHVAKPVAPAELAIVIATLTGRSSLMYGAT